MEYEKLESGRTAKWRNDDHFEYPSHGTCHYIAEAYRLEGKCYFFS